MMFVCDAVDGDIGKELRKKNPDPHFLQNRHQWLKKFGRETVHDQITAVVTIMKLCENMDDFRQKFAKLFKSHLRRWNSLLLGSFSHDPGSAWLKSSECFSLTCVRNTL